MLEYKFSNTWFEDGAKPYWDKIIPSIKPAKILEIGSYEGASACYIIDTLANDYDVEIHCIDTWEGGVEHKSGGLFETDMNIVESRFKDNTALAILKAECRVNLVVHKGYSDDVLASLICAGKKGYFDFIYIDGSHMACDVLSDAVLAFKLLRVGGHMAFDDYLWSEDLPDGKDLLRCPKPAIDAFINLNFRKLKILKEPVQQIYIEKTSD